MATAQRLSYTPTITEDDLLAFQYSHFGDNTKPNDWFVDAESALNFGYEDGDLGYYDDGAKRTLTDEQIALFRHSEIQQLLRERKALEEDQSHDHADVEEINESPKVDDALPEIERVASPVSDTSEASSVEADLIAAAANPDHDYQKLKRPEQPMRPHRSDSISSHATSNATSSNTTSSNGPGKKLSHATRQLIARARRKRRNEAKKEAKWQAQVERERIPYDQRNKRKWEKYIKDEDPSDGYSLTERRVVRELDNAQKEEVEMDY